MRHNLIILILILAYTSTCTMAPKLPKRFEKYSSRNYFYEKLAFKGLLHITNNYREKIDSMILVDIGNSNYSLQIELENYKSDKLQGLYNTSFDYWLSEDSVFQRNVLKGIIEEGDFIEKKDTVHVLDQLYFKGRNETVVNISFKSNNIVDFTFRPRKTYNGKDRYLTNSKFNVLIIFGHQGVIIASKFEERSF